MTAAEEGEGLEAAILDAKVGFCVESLAAQRRMEEGRHAARVGWKNALALEFLRFEP